MWVTSALDARKWRVAPGSQTRPWRLDLLPLQMGTLAQALAAKGMGGPRGRPADAEGAVIEVVGVEYAYEGMPTSVPVGTSLSLKNEGIEFHELAVARIGDDVTESVEELLAMGEAAITSGTSKTTWTWGRSS